jgi:hypothetical protein
MFFPEAVASTDSAIRIQNTPYARKTHQPAFSGCGS